MKILFLTDNFLPHWGGSRVIFYNICKNLPPGEIVVLTRYTKNSKEFDKKQDFKIYRILLFTLPKKFFGVFYQIPIYLFLFFATLFVICRERPQILFVGESLPSGFIAYLIKKMLALPYVVFTFAEDITILSMFKRESRIQHSVLNSADKVIATCSFIEGFLRKEIGIPPQRILKILPGIGEEIINFQIDRDRLSKIKSELQLEDKKVIFTCARLIERKGVDNVIKSLPRVIEKIPNLIYLIGGEGEHRKNLENLVRLHRLERYVRFIGKIHHYKDLPYFYALCDIFIMPSRRLKNQDVEGFGLVFLEAGVFEKPVIGPNIGGPTDAVLDGITGLQIDPYDIDEISQALIKILSDREFAQNLGRNARKRVIDEFRWPEKVRVIYDLARNIKRLYA